MSCLADVVIPAAGVGKRMGASIPKQYIKLGNLTVLERTCEIFLNDPHIAHVIVAVSPEDPFYQLLPLSSHHKVVTVEGGKERANSVFNALKYVTTPYVVVHDAARPLLHTDDLQTLLNAGFNITDGAILAVKMSDTVKASLLQQNGEFVVERTVPREHLWRALTPQMFKTDILTEAMEAAFLKNEAITDEASAVECIGLHPSLVECCHPNFKLTSPSDLMLAQALLHFEGKYDQDRTRL